MEAIITKSPLTQRCASQFGLKIAPDDALQLEWNPKDLNKDYRVYEKGAIKKYGITKDDVARYRRVMEFNTPEAQAMLARLKMTPKEVRARILQARRTVASQAPSKQKFYNTATRTYAPERQALHDKAIRHFVPASATEESTVLMTGGVPASGKSSMLKHPKIKNRFKGKPVTIDPDDIKAFLAKADGIDKLTVQASIYHEESVDVMVQVLKKALDDKKAVILDSTMRQEGKIMKIIGEIKAKNYKIELAFNDLPIEKAMVRSIERYLSGDRFVDPIYIATHDAKNIGVFGKAKSVTDGWSLFNADVAYGKLAKLQAESAIARTHRTYKALQGNISSNLRYSERLANHGYSLATKGKLETLVKDYETRMALRPKAVQPKGYPLAKARLTAMEKNLPVLPLTNEEAVNQIVESYKTGKLHSSFYNDLSALEKKRMASGYKKLFGTGVEDANLTRMGMVQEASNSAFSGGLSPYKKMTGDIPVIFRVQTTDDLFAGQNIGDIIHIYDLKGKRGAWVTGIKNTVPQSGMTVVADAGGMESIIRHEYGHTIDNIIRNDFEVQKFTTAHFKAKSSKAIQDELTFYASKDKGEMVAEMFSVMTQSNYDASKFTPWVRELEGKIREWAKI